ncbi:hypothetical protein [Couchioplanes caeruleus]|uniref:Uncharacterized protein n=1 Tax=Couchioplanes caeruleus TaxID=56438 RepID=A0A3N1GGZ2_9ACTN|nr:hypothetical protein [Couchioplanes caeruleus]ROP29527.1 hypothetical protein EDD30_2325 [Couchioplanes caeruleus]
MRLTNRWGWIDDDANRRRDREAAERRERRRAEYEAAEAQANTAETIPPTGGHHRSDGQ